MKKVSNRRREEKVFLEEWCRCPGGKNGKVQYSSTQEENLSTIRIFQWLFCDFLPLCPVQFWHRHVMSFLKTPTEMHTHTNVHKNPEKAFSV